MQFINPEKWHGYYVHSGMKYLMELDDFRLGTEILAHGSDNVGKFVMKGKVDGNKVEFIKKYIDKHTVYCQGVITKDNIIQGKWVTGTAQGLFALEKYSVNICKPQ